MSEVRRYFHNWEKVGMLILIVVFGIFVQTIQAASPNDACFASGCHDSTSQKPIDHSLYDSNPHKIIKCIDCHENSIDPGNDSNHGQFIRQLNGSNIRNSGPLTTKYYSQNFSLCYSCHNESKLIGVLNNYNVSKYHNNNKTVVNSIGTNFINILPIGLFDGNKDYPTNIHWNHLDDFGSVNRSGKFDSNKDGIVDSYQSCPACHDVHGTNYPKMTKNSMAISYSSDINGTYGYIGSSDYMTSSVPGEFVCDACHNAGPGTKYYRNETNLFVDCISCHMDNVDNLPNISLVNRTAFKQGVHIDINKTDGLGFINNSDCRTCHLTSDMNRSNISQCKDCHTGTGTPEAPTAPKITTHTKTNYSCVDCHSKVINDPGTGFVNVTSHYLKRPIITAPKYCDYCHGPNATAPFPALNKTIPALSHDDPNWGGNATCRTCHTNSSVSADPLANNTSSFHDLTTELGDVNGSVKADCYICHVQKLPQFVAAPSPPHDTSGMDVTDCRNCHTTGAGTQPQKLHSVTAFATGGCIPCHSNNATRYYVDTSLFGKHANVNSTGGPNNVTDDDCKTCHFGSANGTMKMVLGAANSSNTYFCDACHTTAGSGPIHPTDPNLLKNSLQHGYTNCQWCHIAGDPLPRPLINENESLRYHPNGPKGTASGKDCLNCHYYPTPTELLFHAPLEKHETDMNNCGDCHEQADNHGVTPDPWSKNPPSVFSLSVTTPISSGTDSQIQAIILDDYMRMAAARYQVTNNSGVVIDWTYMNPVIGFESVNASIDTSRLLGIYNVNVQGMAWAPKSGGGSYYPLNGQWSGVRTTTLNVTKPTGYANGTVSGTLGNISGAIVSTNTSISATTNSTGFYSLRLPVGTYVLTASKEPEYYPNSVVVEVTALSTIKQNIFLTAKPKGTIIGNVTSK